MKISGKNMITGKNRVYRNVMLWLFFGMVLILAYGCKTCACPMSWAERGLKPPNFAVPTAKLGVQADFIIVAVEELVFRQVEIGICLDADPLEVFEVPFPLDAGEPFFQEGFYERMHDEFQF